MEKNNLVLLGLLGALGVGAYYMFSKNNDNGIIGGGAGGGGSSNRTDPAISPINYIFNVAAPSFPDLSGVFTDTTTTTTTTAAITAKKDTAITFSPQGAVFLPKTIAANIPAGVVRSGSGGVEGLLIKGTTNDIFIVPGAKQTAGFMNAVNNSKKASPPTLAQQKLLAGW